MAGFKKKQRIRLLMLGGVSLVSAAILAGVAFQDAIAFSIGPSELMEKHERGEAVSRYRLGGMVEEGTIVRGEGGEVRFAVTDFETSLPVRFVGVPPDLFREGQGVVAEGALKDGVFHAETILARHDESYMPKEAVDALKSSGKWRGE